MRLAVTLFQARFQLVVQLEHGLAGSMVEQSGTKTVYDGGQPAADQTQTETSRKKEMFEIAFMDAIEMFLAFIKHTDILTHACASDNSVAHNAQKSVYKKSVIF
jgi:hypothetical protein